MCYAKPGPRCAYHVRIDINKAQQLVESAKTSEEYSEAADKLQKALDDYDMTPSGQDELREQIAESTDRLEEAVLQQRLERGMLLRKQAKEALEAKKRESTENMSEEEIVQRNIREHKKRMQEWDKESARLAAENDFSHISPNQWYKKKTLVFDLETTGVDTEEARIVTASILEIYGDPFNPEKVVSREWTVNPGVEIPEGAANVHGVTTEKARATGIPPKMAVEEITKMLKEEQLKGIPVVGYNVSYDFTTLDREAQRHNVEFMDNEDCIIIDPLVIDYAKEWRPRGKGRRTLSVLNHAYGLPAFDAHNSTADCLATAQIAYRQANDYYSDLRIAPETLTSIQRNWHLRRAREFNTWADSKGRDHTSTYVGIHPRPDTQQKSYDTAA